MQDGYFFSLKTDINQSKGYGCICLDLSLDLLLFWNGVYEDFKNSVIQFIKEKRKKKSRQKNLSTNENKTIYCNLGLMHQKDHKKSEI